MAPPPNNDYANAALLAAAGGTISGTTFDATQEASESTTIGSSQQSVWYYFVPGSTGWYKFWVPITDVTYHGIYAFNNSSLALRLFPDGALTAMTLTNEITEGFINVSNGYDGGCAAFLTSGVTYKLRLSCAKDSGTATNSQTSDFTLHWGAVSPPANDALASATVLGSVPVSQTGQTTFDATYETGEVIATTLAGSTGNPTKEQSVWYKFTPSVTGNYKFGVSNVSLRGNHPIQGIIQVSTQSTLAGYTPANEMGRWQVSLFSPTAAYSYFTLTSGVPYYIRVSAAYGEKQSAYSYNSDTFDFDLSIALVTPPANDDFANAITLSAAPGTITGTMRDATADAGQSVSYPFDPGDQTVWYKFTPSVTGQYKFKLPAASLVYNGDNSNPNAGHIQWAVAIASSAATFVYANIVGGTVAFQDYFTGLTEDEVLLLTLTSGQLYYICVFADGTPFNNYAVTFGIEYSFVTPPSNNNFASATAISGSSGNTAAVFEGATVEASEQAVMYWGDPQTQGTIWYDWTCPATGDYVFKVESTDDSTSQTTPSYEMAVWQGSALGSLTAIARTWVGAQNTEGRIRCPGTAVGFAAVSGQHYKIQIASGFPVTVAAKLSWRTNTTTGKTTGTALSMPNGRTDNFGNDNTEVPPNVATILSTHDSWWFTDGRAGRVKWFKKVIGTNQTLTINGRQFDGLSDSGSGWNVSDGGLIVYKGANFAGLTVAKQTGTTVDAAMMLTGSVYVSPSNHFGNMVSLPIPGFTDGVVDMHVDALAGETVWIALFGMYDADYAGSVAADAMQFELDLHVPTTAPGNDDWAAVWGDSAHYAFNLNQGKYDSGPYYWSYPWAGLREGSTTGADAEVGELARAGFAATRSVWYYMSPGANEIWKFWVESSVDCVLGIYDCTYTGGLLALIAEDDDSGPGNQPEITIDFTYPNPPGVYTGNAIAVVVDSKAEGDFTLKFQKQVAGTPPANDNFANAVVISSIPSSVSGTTIGATCEPEEGNAVELGSGPRDTVWYKYVATFNGQVKIKATCDSSIDDAYVYVDTWQGTTLANLIRHPEPPPQGPGGGIWRGFFNHFDTPDELDKASVILDVQTGQTYYIRVQTETGGSEDFTIFTNVAENFIDIQVSGSEEFHGNILDSATVPVDIQVSSVEDFHMATGLDAAEIYINIQPGSPNEFKAFEYKDQATVYYNISIDSHDCQTKWDPTQLTAYGRRRYETRTNGRWTGTRGYRRYEAIGGDGLEEC